eukprot:PhM_4_TR2174/c0_g1_i1/m.13011
MLFYVLRKKGLCPFCFVFIFRYCAFIAFPHFVLLNFLSLSYLRRLRCCKTVLTICSYDFNPVVFPYTETAGGCAVIAAHISLMSARLTLSKRSFAVWNDRTSSKSSSCRPASSISTVLVSFTR